MQNHVKDVYHFYGIDKDTGKILHLHVFYKILTGESLIKNLKFEIGDLLLKDTSHKSEVIIPNAQVELIIFIIRIFSKHQSIIEYLLLLRNYNNIKRIVGH